MDFKDVINIDRLYDVGKVVLGGLITAGLFVQRNRLRTLLYTVSHYRIGASNSQQHMGKVEVIWEGNPLKNVWESKILVENTSGKDMSDVDVTVWSNEETLILNERCGLHKSPDAILWKPEFAERLAIPAGQVASGEQVRTLQHRREYRLPVFNRGQIAEFVYQTTVPDHPGPSLWVHVRKEGFEARYRPNEALFRGVPQRHAVRVGLVFALVFFIAVYFALPERNWLTVLVFVVAVNYLPIGALLYRAAKFVHPILRL